MRNHPIECFKKALNLYFLYYIVYTTFMTVAICHTVGKNLKHTVFVQIIKYQVLTIFYTDIV